MLTDCLKPEHAGIIFCALCDDDPGHRGPHRACTPTEETIEFWRRRMKWVMAGANPDQEPT